MPDTTTEWGVEQDLPIVRTGGPSRHVRRMQDRAEADWVLDGARRSPIETRPVLMRRTVTYGPWEPAPAETSAEGDQRTGPERVRDAIRRDRGRDAPITPQVWA